MADQPTPPQPLEYHTPQAKVRTFSWLRVGVGLIVALFILSSILIPSNRNYRDLANRVRSASNLRQIGQAILIYSNENKGAYPDSFETLLMTEDITPEVFVSPFSNDTQAVGPTTRAAADNLMAGGHCSYVYLGSGFQQKALDANAVVAYEPGVNPSHTYNVLFADGHVESCGPIWWKSFNAKLAARSTATTQPVVLPGSAQ